MRKGVNLSKDILITTIDSLHRVIIPLYIPNEDAYYAEAYSIFEYCLYSIIKTSSTKLKISVISNNSCNSVNEKLLDLQKRGFIDELIIEKEPIGKINSILKSLRTAEERLITITDADVLFCNGWEDGVYEVFKNFPKAGSVSPVPVFRKHLNLTTNIWFRYFFSKKLFFRPVKNPEAMERFAQSIGWDSLEIGFKDVIGTLESDYGTIASLGTSHFVATYKREVFDMLPKLGAKYKLGGDSEFLYTDIPVVKMGGYRLSTYDNYAYHIGNHLESYILEAYSNIKDITEKKSYDYRLIPKLKKKYINYIFYEKLFKKIFYFKKIYRLILEYKGLSKLQSNKFVP